MTFLIATFLILIGFLAMVLSPPNRVAIPILTSGVIILVLRTTGALAADIPVYRPLPVSKSEMRALRGFIAKGKPQRSDRVLQAHVGKRRFE